MPEIVRSHAIDDLSFDSIHYYLAKNQAVKPSWDDVSAAIKETFNRLDIPEWERKCLAGVATLLEAIDHLQLSLPRNPPFNFFQEPFHPGMLLFYAVENYMIINGFHFATFKQQNTLHIGSHRDMCLPWKNYLFPPSAHRNTLYAFTVQFLRYTSRVNLFKWPASAAHGSFSKFPKNMTMDWHWWLKWAPFVLSQARQSPT
jgi:hypothetical protein